MYEQEKITPYHVSKKTDHTQTIRSEKASQVEQMFDHIAPTYDKLNHRLSWDIDKGWRKKAIKALAPYQPQSLLDIATDAAPPTVGRCRHQRGNDGHRSTESQGSRPGAGGDL